LDTWLGADGEDTIKASLRLERGSIFDWRKERVKGNLD
jgi:hypothetical protein